MLSTDGVGEEAECTLEVGGDEEVGEEVGGALEVGGQSNTIHSLTLCC